MSSYRSVPLRGLHERVSRVVSYPLLVPSLPAPSDALLATQDVEDDLARGTNIYLPRIMHRLLYTLSQDRKIKSVLSHRIQRLLTNPP